MKFLQLISTAVLLIFILNSAQAQLASTNDFAMPKFGLIEKGERAQRISFFLNYNSFPMKTKESIVDFSYRDESPSPSEIKQTINLNNTSNVTGLVGGLEWQTKRNLMFRLFIGGGGSNGRRTKGNYFSFGTGYAIGNERIQVFPMIDFMLINGKMNFADLKGDGYTVINEKEFYSNAINTYLTTSFTGIKPALGANFNINKRIGINANVGYVMGSANGTTSINFSEDGPRDQDGNTTTISATEKLSESNVKFIVDGTRETTRTSVFKTGGLTWSVGLNFNIANRLFDGK